MSWTYRLRHNLSKYDDADGGHHYSYQSRTGDIIQQDGQGGVDQNIPQKKRAKQVVPLAPDGLDLPGVVLLLLRPAVLDDLQLHGIQRHQTQVQAAEHAREAEQHGNEDDLDPEREQELPLLHHDHFGVLSIVIDPRVLRPRVVRARRSRCGGGDAQVVRFTPLSLSQRLDLDLHDARRLAV